MMLQGREEPEVPEADISGGVPLETHFRQDRRGLGLPRPPGDHHGPGQLRHGLHHLAVWPRQALAGQRPGEQHLPAVLGLGQPPRPSHPLQCRVCPHRGSPGHRVRHPRDEGHPEGGRAEGVFNIQVS